MSEDVSYFARCQGIIPLHEAQQWPINIIGCGATGSYTALALAKMGFNKFFLYDDDVVEEANIGPQLFGPEHIGQAKVEALESLLKQLSPANEVFSFNERVDQNVNLNRGITVLAVDSMRDRISIFNRIRRVMPLVVDPRIGGQIIRVFSIPLNATDYLNHYRESLYSDEEAMDLPCAERGVADVSFLIGGLISGIIRKFVTRKEAIKEYYLDVMNMESYKVE